MADPPRSSEPKFPSTPRWVKVSGIVAIVVILVMVLILIAGGGEHGPSRHLSGIGDPGRPTSAVQRSS